MSSLVLHNLSAHFVWCKYFTMLAWPLFHERSATPTDAMLASWCEVLPHFFAPPGQKTVLGMFSSSTRLRSFATTSSYLLATLETAGCHAATFHLAQFRALLKWTLSFAHCCQSFFTANLLHFAATHSPPHHLPTRTFATQQSLWSTVTSGTLDKMFPSSHDLAAATADYFSTTGFHAAAALALSVCCTFKDLAALFRLPRSALPSAVRSTDEAAFSIRSDSAEDDPIQSFTHRG